jgi:CRISPR/Cas system-associated exonuclease Cas4 (RecB family)
METPGLSQARITGTEINYLFVCHRKLWLFHHHIEMEHTSDYVALGQLQEPKHFSEELGACYLNEAGRRIFLQAYDDQLKKTIEHRRLKRKVSYQRLIRLECYKLIKHLTDMEPYQAFRAWW